MPSTTPSQLKKIRKHLVKGDRAAVAEACQVSKASITMILKGQRKNDEVLQALIDRALANQARKLEMTQKLDTIAA